MINKNLTEGECEKRQGQKKKTIYEVWEERRHAYEEVRPLSPWPGHVPETAVPHSEPGGSRTARW